MKIGDIVENGYAGEGNPNKRTMYIRFDGKCYVCMTKKGTFCHYPKNNDRLKVVGHIEIKF